jgi:DNA repair protein RecO (recombination protein O)
MIKTLALVLKKQNIGETDRIITIFSPTLGKKRVVARAVRKPLSKLSGHLDTLMLSQIILTDEENLPKITSAELIESFELIRDSLPKMQRAFAITKLVERVILEDVSQQAVFQLTLDAILRLNNDEPWHNTWLYFLTKLMEKLGVNIHLTVCENCGKTLENGAYWQTDERQFRCKDCGSHGSASVYLHPNSLKLLNLLLKQQFNTVTRIGVPLPVAQELEEIFLREITQWLNKPWASYSSLTEKD